MPETYLQSSVWEAALSVHSRTPHHKDIPCHEEGDIISVRKESYRIGSGEFAQHLWVCLTGLDDNLMPLLAKPWVDGEHVIAKRRYGIPFDRLKDALPLLDIAKVQNTDVPYQPCVQSEHIQDLTQTGVDVDMAVSPGTVAEGWIRIPFPSSIECLHGQDAFTKLSDSSPTIVQMVVPTGWSWDFPWKRRMAMDRDELKAEFGTWKAAYTWMRNETATMCTDGPLINIRNPEGESKNAVISYVVKAKALGVGRYYHKTPPLDVAGLIYDKAKQSYIGEIA